MTFDEILDLTAVRSVLIFPIKRRMWRDYEPLLPQRWKIVYNTLWNWIIVLGIE